MKFIINGRINLATIGRWMKYCSKIIFMKKVLLFLIYITCNQLASAQDKEDFYIVNDSMMMTIILRHQQQNPVDSIQNHVMKQHFYEKLNQSHARILSWNVVMGIGQIITLRLTANYIREVNQVFESGAWGGFTTEFYPTYDFLPIYPRMLQKEELLHQK